MGGKGNRKWRKYYKHNKIRIFLIFIIILVLIHYLEYIIWQKYKSSSPKSLVIHHSNYTVNENAYQISNYSHYSHVASQKCERSYRKLVGIFTPKLVQREWRYLERIYNYMEEGHWYPNCTEINQQKVAIIIPYRNREGHLKILMHNLHAMLQRQNVIYGIFVINQLKGSQFNRAALFNIGVLEALKWDKYNCFIFHDVDLIPENDLNIYDCGSRPKHLSAYIDKFNYRLPYEDIFGGVCAMTIQQLQAVNGFSNLYFGWGGEDDDMHYRLETANYSIFRYPFGIGRYRMIKHSSEHGNSANPHRFRLYNFAPKRMYQDGLNSIQYQVVNVKVKRLMIMLNVHLDQVLITQNFSNLTGYVDRFRVNDVTPLVMVFCILLGCLILIFLFTFFAIHITNTGDQNTRYHNYHPVVKKSKKTYY